MTASTSPSQPDSHPTDNRRSWFAKLSIGLGALLGIPPLGSGIAFLMSPITRHKATRDSSFQKVTPVETLTLGIPRRFTISGNVTDAWNRYSRQLGAVYIIRETDAADGPTVSAFQADCPHAGCAVSFRSSSNNFQCPCHESSFSLDGKIANQNSPAARGLDHLETKIEDGFVFVKFEKFVKGTPEKISVS